MAMAVEAGVASDVSSRCNFEHFAQVNAPPDVFGILQAGGAFSGRYDLAKCSFSQSARGHFRLGLMPDPCFVQLCADAHSFMEFAETMRPMMSGCGSRVVDDYQDSDVSDSDSEVSDDDNPCVQVQFDISADDSEDELLDWYSSSSTVHVVGGTGSIDNNNCHNVSTDDALKTPISDDLMGCAFDRSEKPFDKSPVVSVEAFLEASRYERF